MIESETKTRIDKIVLQLEQVKATDIVAYDLEHRSPFFRYVIIATATDKQSNAAISYIKEALEGDCKVEGKGGGWLLIDAHDIIIHIFTSEIRKYYSLDLMYIGLPKIL